MIGRPPRLIEWLVAFSLPDDCAERDAVLGDLAEEHAEIAAAGGRVRADAWYSGQAARSVLPNLYRRWTRRRQRAPGPRLTGDIMHPGRRGFSSLKALFAGAASDFRVAFRGLKRRPAFTATAAVTVALGIGATTAVFSVVDATVLRGLHVPNPDRLVSLWSVFERHPGQEFAISAAEFMDLRSDVRSFARTGAWSLGETLLEPREGGAARTIHVAYTFGDIYALVGARTVLGRLPGEGDDRPDAPAVGLLSHALWTDAFGADPDIVGTHTLRVGAGVLEVVGVLAPGVVLPGADAGVWVHSVLNPASWASDRSGHGLEVLGLLREGTTEGAARAELASLHQAWAGRYAGQHSFGLDGHAARLEPIRERMLGRARRVGLLLSIAAGLLLVLACANVANLLLARGESRMSEVGVRVALGASSRRVAQPVLLEGLILGAVGGLMGLGLAVAGLPALLSLAPADLVSATAVRIDVRVVLFAIAVSMGTSILFTMAPAWNAARRAPSDLLRTSGRGRTGTTRGLRILVAGQVALATGLLIGAALFSVSLHKLNAVNPGLDTTSRIALDLTLPTLRYRDAGAIIAFYDLAQQRLASVPGIDGVTVVRNLPLRDQQRQENVIRDGAADREDRLGIAVQAGSAGVLRTLGIPILEGRDLATSDRAGSVRVALLNRAAARALWPGRSAIGQRLRPTFLPPDQLVTIVGVYGDVRSAGLSANPTGEMILPVAQADGLGGWIRNLTVVIRTSAPPEAAIAATRAALRELDPTIAVELPTTLQEVLRASTARERFLAALLAVFSGLALVVAAVGVFGVVSFTVARQTRDFAIRNALGARPSEILRGVLTANAMTAGAGAVAGAALVALFAPALGGFLYDIAPRNGAVFVGAPLVLVVVALASSLVPAFRAMRVPLVRALQDGD